MELALRLDGGTNGGTNGGTDGGTDDDLRDLLRWLRDEDELRGTRLTARERPGGAHDMGPVVDALLVGLGSGGAGVVLLRSIAGWLRVRGSDVVVSITTKDGVTAKADIKRLRDPQAAVEIISALRGEADRAAP